MVPRLMNPKSASIDAIDAVLAHLDDVEECTTVIFSGTEAFGSPHNLSTLRVAFLEMGIAPGMVEFSTGRRPAAGPAGRLRGHKDSQHSSFRIFGSVCP